MTSGTYLRATAMSDELVAMMFVMLVVMGVLVLALTVWTWTL